jgi:alkanesulfonate monooxygenase SsuD/methylene tetrahydromethanopterin reductase-like flavin-dependent oxidoreductase (luciferase family)
MAGRLADGYLAQRIPGSGGGLEEQLNLVRAGAEDAGRDPDSIGLQGLLPVVGKSRAEIHDLAGHWQDLGATHLTVDPRSVSLHVHQDLSMEENAQTHRTSSQALIAEVDRATEALRDISSPSNAASPNGTVT